MNRCTYLDEICTNMYLDNFYNPIEFQCQRSRSCGFWVFFGVSDAAATRGQYLALSKAWLSCLFFYFFSVTEQTFGALFGPQFRHGFVTMIYLMNKHRNTQFLAQEQILATWICVVVFSPIDFINETDRRWTMAACFIVLANTILSMLDGVNIVNVEPQNDPEYERKFHWVSSQYRLLLFFSKPWRSLWCLDWQWWVIN